MKKYSDLTNVSKTHNSHSNNATTINKGNPNNDSRSQLNINTSAISDSKPAHGTDMLQYQTVNGDRSLCQTQNMAKTNTAYQNCNTISNANNKHFNQVALQNISDNTKNFLTERQTITNQFNNGLASSEGLRMMVQNNSNKKPEESNEDKSSELKERIFQSYHSKLNSNINLNIKALSPDTKNEAYRQMQSKLATNSAAQKKYFSNGKVYTETSDINTYMNRDFRSQNDRDLTPQSQRNIQEHKNNTGSKKKKDAKVAKHLMTPQIENNKNHFFTNFNNQHLQNSPTIKENISKFITPNYLVNNILEMSKLNNQNSPGNLSNYNQRLSYAEKCVSKENHNDMNLNHAKKGYGEIYKESKDFKQQILDIKNKTRSSKNNFHHNTEEAVKIYI